MADCVSMPNAAELVEELRSETHFMIGNFEGGFAAPTEKELKAADAIEALMQENAKLKAERDHWEKIARERGEHYRQMRRERDAAVADLKDFSDSESCCFYCRKRDTFPCRECIWEWRGPQKEEEE